MLDTKTKQKLLDYSTKKAVQTSTKNENDFENIISWMSADIAFKIGQKNITEKTRQTVNSGDFYLSLYRQLLGNSLNQILDDSFLPQNDLQTLRQSTDLEELLTKLVMFSTINSQVSEKIIKAIINSYLGKCLEFGVLADEYVVGIITS
jgi:Fe-S-cluster formation regulator IscX/YfhJ